MTVVTLEEAKTRMEELAHLAVSGEEVLITQDKKPTLALKPVAQTVAPGPRIPGMWAGKFEIGEAFFEPMPDEWLGLFYNGPAFPEEKPGSGDPGESGSC
jgi:antitoxin (DNA-binding transcriptional repressor) of toxin-antitoxin stability system